MPVPGEGWVLVKVKACGVCGSDIPRVMKTGTYRFPTIPGHEFAGEVAELGPGVEGTKGVEEGLRVTVIARRRAGRSHRLPGWSTRRS